MRRIIILMITINILCLLIGIFTGLLIESKHHIPEDVNRDGIVDGKDLLQIQKYVLREKK